MGAAPPNTFPHPTIRSDIQDTEDCLYLNVYMPGNVVPSRKLPVMVWIHGGGYIFWNASMFDAQNLVQRSNNAIIAVTIQYRLGVLGFLSGNEVKANGALNAGLLDQEFALQWVQKHIAKFGGDLDQVTIWGASAGGGAVLQHVVARDGRTDPPLFRGAMASSMFLPSQYVYNDTVPEFIFAEVVSRVGCNNQPDVMQCLRGTDLSLIQSANTDINKSGFFGTFVVVPVIDGEFITQRPTQALIQGKVNGRALLATNVINEGNLVVNQSTAPTVNVTQFAGDLFPGLDQEQRAEVARVYAPLGAPIDQVNAIMGESTYICPTYFFLQAFPDRSFKGQYAVPPALHGDDVPLSFPSFGQPKFNDPLFTQAYAQSFIGFTRGLDPNFEANEKDNTTHHWPRYNDARIEMIFNRSSEGNQAIQPSKSDKDLLHRCAFWASVSEFTMQ